MTFARRFTVNRQTYSIVGRLLYSETVQKEQMLIAMENRISGVPVLKIVFEIYLLDITTTLL